MKRLGIAPIALLVTASPDVQRSHRSHTHRVSFEQAVRRLHSAMAQARSEIATNSPGNARPRSWFESHAAVIFRKMRRRGVAR